MLIIFLRYIIIEAWNQPDCHTNIHTHTLNVSQTKDSMVNVEFSVRICYVDFVDMLIL